MAIYNTLPPHKRLDVFFGEFFREVRKAPPQVYGNFFARAEEEFKRTGYREKNSSGIENILIVRLDAIGDQIKILTYSPRSNAMGNFLGGV